MSLPERMLSFVPDKIGGPSPNPGLPDEGMYIVMGFEVFENGQY
jgi:hypothetical protein